jgi:predicted nucleotidyltransferase
MDEAARAGDPVYVSSISLVEVVYLVEKEKLPAVVLERLTRALSEKLNKRLLASDGERIRRVILYGSRALGSATEDSDFDLLVVEKDPVSKRDEMRRFRAVLSDLQYPVDVWVMGEEEFEETRNIIGGLAYPAHKYGVVLYENG